MNLALAMLNLDSIQDSLTRAFLALPPERRYMMGTSTRSRCLALPCVRRTLALSMFHDGIVMRRI